MGEGMMDTVTHLAGPHVGVSGRVVQRCCVCGEKLCDNINTAMALNPDGTQPEFPTWKTGSYVRVERNQHLLVGHWDDDELPADFCLPLVE
jgi:hypothetical protein